MMTEREEMRSLHREVVALRSAVENIERALRDRLVDTLNVRQVADILGVHKATVWRYVASGKLPEPRRRGNRAVWNRSDVEALA